MGQPLPERRRSAAGASSAPGVCVTGLLLSLAGFLFGCTDPQPGRGADAPAGPVLGQVRSALTGPELDPSVPVTSQSGRQTDSSPAVAFDGTQHFVAWVDLRRGVDLDIFATRVTTDGGVLDERGIAVTTAAGNDRWPSAAAGAGHFLVTWESTTLADVFAARLDGTGRVLDAPVALPVAVSPAPERRPKVAFDGQRFLVVWQEGTDGGRVLARRLEPTGAFTEASPFVVAGGAWPQVDPRIACAADGCFVAWTDGRDGGEDVYGAWIDRAGTVSPGEGIALTSLPSSQRAGAVAAVDGGFLVVWEDRRAGDEDLYGARVPRSPVPAATRLGDLDGFALCDGGVRQLAPFVVDARPYPLMIWVEFRSATGYDAYYSRVDVAAGVLVDTPPLLTATGGGGRWQLSPGLSWNGERALATWFDNRSEAFDTYYGRLITPGGPMEAERVVALASNRQLQPRVAASAAGYLVVWSDRRGSIDTAYQVQAGMIELDGQVRDGGDLILSAEPPGPLTREPVAASDGSNTWLVVWASQNGSTEDLWYARLDALGNRLGDAGLLVGGAGNQSYPEVAFDGRGFVVAWSDARSGSWDQHVQRFGPSPSPAADGGFVLAGGAGTQGQARLACLDGSCLLTWIAAAPDGGQQLLAGLWSAEAGPQGPPALVADTLPSQSRASVAAASDAGYFVAWRDLSSRHGASPEPDAGTGLSIYGQRFAPDGGAHAPPVRLSRPNGSPSAPAVAFDGRFWLVVWTDSSAADSGTVFAARATLDGLALDDGGVALASGLASQPSQVSLAGTGGGLSLLAYTRFDEMPPYSSHRARVRLVATASLELGERCTSALECASGACVDGRCCESSCGGGIDRCLVCSVEAGGAIDGTCSPASSQALRACRPASSECDVEELCLGATDCPADVSRADGTPCDGGTCSSGVCVLHDAGHSRDSVTLRLGCDCGTGAGGPHDGAPTWLLALALLGLAASARPGRVRRAGVSEWRRPASAATLIACQCRPCESSSRIAVPPYSERASTGRR